MIFFTFLCRVQNDIFMTGNLKDQNIKWEQDKNGISRKTVFFLWLRIYFLENYNLPEKEYIVPKQNYLYSIQGQFYSWKDYSLKKLFDSFLFIDFDTRSYNLYSSCSTAFLVLNQYYHRLEQCEGCETISSLTGFKPATSGSRVLCSPPASKSVERSKTCKSLKCYLQEPVNSQNETDIFYGKPHRRENHQHSHQSCTRNGCRTNSSTCSS